MARKQNVEEAPASSIPTWFITYSDVITLLMTFFILLLTFATSEPEKFEQMQVSMFGSAGATGFVRDQRDRVDRDSLVIRIRPDASRIATKGSETAPLHSDPLLESIHQGLQGMEEEPKRKLDSTYAIQMELNLVVDRNGQLTPLGQQRLRMIARHLQKGAHKLTLLATRTQDTETLIGLGLQLIEQYGIAPGRVSIGFEEIPHAKGVPFVLMLRG